MKVNTFADKANGLEGAEEDVVMGINEDNHLTLLNSLTNLYSNPILAALREYSANASDAHKESHQTKPFEVDFPYLYEERNHLRIRDYGNGMTKDQLVQIYSQYGASTKGSSNRTVGGFGLGSKSGLAVSNHLYVTTVANGVEVRAKILRNEDNTSVIRILSEESSTKESGTEIVLPVTVKQLKELIRGAENELIGYGSDQVLLNGANLKISVHNLDQFIPVLSANRIVAYVQRNDMTERNTFASHHRLTSAADYDEDFLKTNVAVVMGGVYYPSLPSLGSVEAKEHFLSLVAGLRKRLLNSPKIILNIPVGSVDLPPHRDSIIDTVKTWNSLLGLFEDFSHSLETSAQAYLNAYDLPQASALVASMRNLFSTDNHWTHKGVTYDNFIGREITKSQPFLMPPLDSHSGAKVLRINGEHFTSFYAKTRNGEYERSTSWNNQKFSVVELKLSDEKYEAVYAAIVAGRTNPSAAKSPAARGFAKRYLIPYLQAKNIKDSHILLACESKDVIPPHLRSAIDYSFTEEEIRQLHRAMFPPKARTAVQQNHCRVTDKKSLYDAISTNEKIAYFGGKNEYGPDTNFTGGAIVIPSQTAGLKKVSNGSDGLDANYGWTRTGLVSLLGADTTLVALNDTRSPALFQKTFSTAVPLGQIVMDYYDKLDNEHKVAVQHAYSILSRWSVNADPLFSLFVGKNLKLRNPEIRIMFAEPEIVAVANYLWAFKDSYVTGLLEWKNKFVEEMRGKELAGTMLLPVQSLLDATYPSFYTGLYFSNTPVNTIPSKARVRQKEYKLPYDDMVKFIDRLTVT